MQTNGPCSVFSYIHEPILCIFGVISNSVNIFVFMNHKMKDPSFKYMLAISISNVFYLGINSYWFTFYCQGFHLNKYYLTQIYSLYFSEYFERCCALFSLIVEIFLSYERYMVLLNRMNYRNETHNYVLFILLMIALVYYMPLLIFKEIKNFETNSTVMDNSQASYYHLERTEIGSNSIGKILPIILTSLRLFLNICVLTTFNLLNLYEFRKRYSKIGNL